MSRKLLTFALMGLFAVRAQAETPLTPADWVKYYAPLKAQHTDPQAVDARAINPIFDGRVFLIESFNHPAYRDVTFTRSYSVIDTIITSSTTSGILQNSWTLGSATTVTSNMRGYARFNPDTAIAFRTNWLVATQGMTPDAAQAQATAEVHGCVSNCGIWVQMPGKEYAQSTTSSASSTSVTKPGPANTSVTTGNTTTTTTYGSTTQTTTTTTQTTVESGAQYAGLPYPDEPYIGDFNEGSVTTETKSGEVTEETPYEETTTTKEEKKREVKEEQAAQEREKKWKARITPTLFVNLTYDNQVEQLSSTFEELGASLLTNDSKTILGKARILTLSPTGQGPFKLTKMIGVNVGVGASVTLNYTGGGALQGLVPYAGLSPIVGATKVTERFVLDRNDLKNAGHLEIPNSVNAITKWHAGDKVTFMTQGGIMFAVGATYYNVLGLGVGAVAAGTWKTEVQKLSNDVALVKLSKGNLKSVTLQASVGLMAVSAAKVKALENGFTFLFKTDSLEGARAFEQMLAGNVVTVQEAAAKRETVIHVDDTASKTTGSMTNYSLALPYLFGWTWGSGKLQVESDVDFHADGSKSDLNYGVYLEQSQETAYLRAVRNKTYGFYGLAYTTTEKDGSQKKAQLAQVGYAFSKHDVTGADLKNAVEDLIKKTGLKQELAVAVPSSAKDQNLGYASLKFMLSLDPSAIETLAITESQSPETLAKVARGFTDGYFANGRDSLGVCDTEKYGYASSQGAEGMKKCEREVRANVSEAVKEMKAALAQMKRAQADQKAVAYQMARFGKAMITNAITFQTVLNLVKGSGVSATYEISGSDILKYDLVFDWKTRPEAEKQ